MSKGVRLDHNLSQESLDKYKGVKILQIAIPATQQNGYILRNFDNTVREITKVGDNLVIFLDGVDESITCFSAVISYEETGLQAIAEFEKEQE